MLWKDSVHDRHGFGNRGKIAKAKGVWKLAGEAVGETEVVTTNCTQ